MNAKMIVFDLDGTLLNKDKVISDYSKEVLRKYKELGGIISIATGRLKEACTTYQIEINADYVVCHNGSIVYKGDEVLTQQNINNHLVRELIDKLMQIDGIRIIVSYPTYMVTNDIEYSKKFKCRYSNFDDLKTTEIQKITINTLKHTDVEKINYDLYECRLLRTMENKNCYYIMPRNIDKVKGIEFLCNMLNIKIDDVVSFGDDLNDVEMLKKCGIGVVVDNADDYVKNQIPKHCKSNDEDGPAKWINDNIINKINV